jgi:hypothetical protein
MLEQELADSLLPPKLDKSPAQMKKPLSRLFRPPVEIGEEKNDFTRWIFHKKRINDEDVHVSGQSRLMVKSSSKRPSRQIISKSRRHAKSWTSPLKYCLVICRNLWTNSAGRTA